MSDSIRPTSGSTPPPSVAPEAATGHVSAANETKPAGMDPSIAAETVAGAPSPAHVVQASVSNEAQKVAAASGAAAKHIAGQDMARFAQVVNEIYKPQDFQALQWTGSYTDYLNEVSRNPKVTRNGFQRLVDMVELHGTEEYGRGNNKQIRYNFCNDPFGDGKDAVFGIDVPFRKLMQVLQAAAKGYGAQARVILMHGPVGTAKSTIARLIKKGLEDYSRRPEGAMYTFDWVNLPRVGRLAEGRDHTNGDVVPSAMRDDPLLLLPSGVAQRKAALKMLGIDPNQVGTDLKQDLDPRSRFIQRELLLHYKGDVAKMLENHVQVRRVVLNEKDRVGIGTFEPKDEKNQDSTELTGNIDFRKIGIFGSSTDPRAFNFDGEFNVANRGVVEFVEMLKLDVAFLYTLLGATAEHSVKPKGMAQTDIDCVILAHTNQEEYERLLKNPFMRALKDRTIKVDIPYVVERKHEHRIYQKMFKGDTFAPHTLDVATNFAVISRLHEPAGASLTLWDKMRLYDGQEVPGQTQAIVRELQAKAKGEGMQGFGPRWIQDRIGQAFVNNLDGKTPNPFKVMNAIGEELATMPDLSDDQRKDYIARLKLVTADYEETIKKEVQMAIAADTGAAARLASNYIDNIKAYALKEKLKNPYTGQDEEADERLMRSIEEKIDIPEGQKDNFRRELMNFIGAKAVEGKAFEWHTNERLRKAVELKLFEDQKDTIKLRTLVSAVVDKETQEKIDVIKARLIRDFGYDDESATDVLSHVASIFARGDLKNP